MSSNNNNNNSSSSKKSSKQAIVTKPLCPIPSESSPIFIEVPTKVLLEIENCAHWCACGTTTVDIRKRKAKVQILRIVEWFGTGSVAPKQNGSTEPNKVLRVNCLLKTRKGKNYYDVHNYWITFTNHHEDRNFAEYIEKFSAFARENGFIDCHAHEDYATKQWFIHPNDIKRKELEAQKKAEPKRKRQVEQFDDLEFFTAEPAPKSQKNQETDPRFIFNGESDSDADSDPKMDEDQSEESEEVFDAKAFRAELETTKPIDSSSDDEGKNGATTLEQFRKESQTAFAFTQDPPQEEAEDAFDDKTVEVTDPTELVEDSVDVEKPVSVDLTLEKTVLVEQSTSDIHAVLASVLASAADDKNTEEKKDQDEYDYLLDFDFRRECEPPKESQVVEAEQPIEKPAEQPVEQQAPEETQPMDVQPEEPKPEIVQSMEVEAEKPTEPVNDVQEAPADIPTPVVETPTVEAPVTETLVVPVPEQPKTQKVSYATERVLRARKQPEKKEEKKTTARTSRRKNKTQ